MRRIPITTQYRIFLNGRTNFMGAVLILFAFLLFMLIVDSNTFKGIYFLGEEEVIYGKIMTVIPINEKQKRVLYQYTVGEEKYSREDFTLNKEIEIGERVKIEYAKKHPHQSRILGEKTDLTFLYILAMLVIGIVMLSVNFKQNLKTWKLIKWGALTRGVLVSKEKIGKESYKLKFQFKDFQGKTQYLYEKTKYPDVYKSGFSETILYMPNNSKIAIIVDKIPKEVHTYI